MDELSVKDAMIERLEVSDLLLPSGTVNGYRVYRFGTLLADLPASTTSYQETVPFTYGSDMNYAVEAYNDAGTGQQVLWDFTCP